MNDERRKRIEKASNAITDAIDELNSVRDDEQEAFDSMPESLQQGERGEASEAAISALEDAISELESARDQLEEAAQ